MSVRGEMISSLAETSAVPDCRDHFLDIAIIKQTRTSALCYATDPSADRFTETC